MSQQPFTNQQIDDLVREHLDRQAADVDAQGILVGVHVRLAASATVPLHRRFVGAAVSRTWAWRAGLVAAALLLAVAGFQLASGPASAEPVSAEAVIRDVRLVYAQPEDHCYSVL